MGVSLSSPRFLSNGWGPPQPLSATPRPTALFGSFDDEVCSLRFTLLIFFWGSLVSLWLTLSASHVVAGLPLPVPSARVSRDFGICDISDYPSAPLHGFFYPCSRTHTDLCQILGHLIALRDRHCSGGRERDYRKFDAG